MEQRRLRLGDIVDDYCPRERRVTNHAVVAMLDEGIKQTRCSTCDAEHPYKGGHAPRRRKKEDPAALYKEVLAGMPEADAAPVLSAPAPATIVPMPEPVAAPIVAAAAAPAKTLTPPAPAQAEPPLEPDPAEPAPRVEDGPVHRTLIRATLPKVEGHKEVRQVPEFTIRQSTGRPAGNYQGADQRGRPRAAGQGQAPSFNRPGNGSRFGGARASNQGHGAPGRRPGGGFQSAPPQGRNGNTAGGRKRPR